MTRFLIIGALLLLGSLTPSCESSEKKVMVAAASSMRPLLEELAKGFEDTHLIQVDFVWGSSASLSTQIIEGAPFDIFFSASEDFANRVKNNGEGIGAPKLFCHGRLAAISSQPGISLNDIITDKVKYISIPDPKAAPYGIAAMKWLDRQNWVDLVDHKFVYAPSASGVVNHIEQGVAEFGITAESVARSSFSNGEFIPLTNEVENEDLLPQHYLLPISDKSQTRDFRIYMEKWAFGDSADFAKPFNDLGFNRVLK